MQEKIWEYQSREAEQTEQIKQLQEGEQVINIGNNNKIFVHKMSFPENNRKQDAKKVALKSNSLYQKLKNTEKLNSASISKLLPQGGHSSILETYKKSLS